MAEDDKAKDVLATLTPRKLLGERLLERVGARRDDAPGAARRRRLFARLGLPDPYEPKASSDPGPGLGPVSLKLSERRRPAPHSRVRDPNRKREGAGSFKPSGVPKAPPKPPPKPAAAAKPAPSEPAPAIDPAIQRRLEAQKKAQEAVEERGRVEAEERKSTGTRGQGGRFRMRRTSATGPKSRPVETPPEETPEAAPEAPPKPPIRRTPPGPAAGPDDLFGFADEGRIRIPRKKKDEP